MSLKIEIYIEESPKSNAASYFEYDSEKHHKMIKELGELLDASEEKDDKKQQYERINNNFCCNGSGKPCCYCCRLDYSPKGECLCRRFSK